ncbi:MAG: hypothetical protein M1820_004504 [Bogoriella megaspora]|nr:MAG: hypothetical protein M1820_004504 [Bogoriella megaspora]
MEVLLIKSLAFSIQSSPRNGAYYNNKTAPYFIEEWPLVSFPTGEFYSGSVPVNESDPSRTLFFVFKPATEAGPVNETTIWFNGGPGCSSLVGLLQENGPILWQPGTYMPTENPYAWSRITNMLWVEWPIGVGFTTGNITAYDEVDAARDFVGFYKNWQKLFEIQHYKTYVTGESYAGRYVPYVAAEMLNQQDNTYFDVAGALIYSPTIGQYNHVQRNVPTYQFVKANNNLFNFNQSYLATLEQSSASCGFTDWLDKYLQFPPPGLQPPVGKDEASEECEIYTNVQLEQIIVHPCVSFTDITQGCPAPFDPLALHINNDPPAYFNRTDVRQALHAPRNFNHAQGDQLNEIWYECALFATNPFLGPIDGEGPEGQQDISPDPTQSVLPQVIEATNRVFLGNGNYDFTVLTNGTLLAIQNMTWNGELGFQQAPSKEFVVPGQGVVGKQHFERGLLWAELYATSHLPPQRQPQASLRHLEWLLGRIDEL